MTHTKSNGRFFWTRQHIEQLMALEVLGMSIYEAIDLVGTEYDLVPLSMAYYQYCKKKILSLREYKK